MPLNRPHHQILEITDGEKIPVDGSPRDALQNGFQIVEAKGAQGVLKYIFPDVGELKVAFRYPIRQGRIIRQEYTGYIGGEKSCLIAGIDQRFGENLLKRFLYGTQIAGLGWTQHTFATGNGKGKNPVRRKPLFCYSKEFLGIKPVHLGGDWIAHIHQNDVVACLRATQEGAGIQVKQPHSGMLKRCGRC